MRQPNESDERAILTGVDPDTRIHAIEENTAAFLLALGRAGGREERDDTEITWTIGGSPLSYHNAIVRANLTLETADAAILVSRERLVAHGVPGSWRVGLSMRPTDLGQRLLAMGFTVLQHLPISPAG
jgi:hypothetical protein